MQELQLLKPLLSHEAQWVALGQSFVYQLDLLHSVVVRIKGEGRPTYVNLSSLEGE